MPNSRSILVIEDEEQLQNVLKQILQLRGYEATPAYSGAAALELLASRRFALILLDLGLPDCRGDELAARVGELTGNRVPVIVISGNPDLSDMAMPACVVKAVTKPFDFADLLQTIARHAAPAREQAEPRAP